MGQLGTNLNRGISCSSRRRTWLCEFILDEVSSGGGLRINEIVERAQSTRKELGSGHAWRGAYEAISTTPALPSTTTCWPSRRRTVASPVPTTAGMPYSRATSEA
jgi:hypothetical protein